MKQAENSLVFRAPAPGRALKNEEFSFFIQLNIFIILILNNLITHLNIFLCIFSALEISILLINLIIKLENKFPNKIKLII